MSFGYSKSFLYLCLCNGEPTLPCHVLSCLTSVPKLPGLKIVDDIKRFDLSSDPPTLVLGSPVSPLCAS